eukprot:3768274-Pyramimonas_sp.AAC.1
MGGDAISRASCRMTKPTRCGYACRIDNAARQRARRGVAHAALQQVNDVNMEPNGSHPDGNCRCLIGGRSDPNVNMPMRSINAACWRARQGLVHVVGYTSSTMWTPKLNGENPM